MYMKKLLLFTLCCLTLSLTSCNFEIENKITELEQRVLALEKYTQTLNTNISSLQTLVNALSENDYVTAVTDIYEDGVLVGYKISFKKSPDAVIHLGQDGKDGTDGKIPYLGIDVAEDGNYYWTVAYGDGEPEFLKDPIGNKIPAVGQDGEDGEDGEDGQDGEDGKDGENGQDGANGQNGTDGITPKLKIEEGFWYVSYDNGSTWNKLGESTGEVGDNIFEGIDTSNPDYIIFTVKNVGTIKIPSWGAFEKLSLKIDSINTNYKNLAKSIEDMARDSYVTNITANKDNDGNIISYSLQFSDDTFYTINNGIKGDTGDIPSLSIKKGEDSLYYWVIGKKVLDEAGEETLQYDWMLDESGNKIQAAATNGTNGQTPYLSIKKDTDDYYYWTIKWGNEEATWLLDDNGFKVKANSTDGVQFFESVDITNDSYIVMTLTSGEVVRLVKYEAYELLRSNVNKITDNILSLTNLVTSINLRTYIKELTPIISESDTIGYKIVLSDNREMSIYNGIDAVAPKISVAKGDDERYYWTVQYGSMPVEWILDEEGNKLLAEAQDGLPGLTPELIVEKDTDGIYYWKIKIGDTSNWITASDGVTKIQAMVPTGDGLVGTSFFESVTADENFLNIVLSGSDDVFKLQFYKEFELKSLTVTDYQGQVYTMSGNSLDITNTLTGTTYTVNYTIDCTYTVPTIEYVTTSTISAYGASIVTNDETSSHTGTFNILAPIETGINDKIILFFSDNAGKTVVRTIYFK